MHTSYPWKLHRTVLARDSPSQVVCQRVYSHKAQVLDIVASPTSTQQFLSAHAGDDGSAGCTLWSMQDLHSAVVMTLTSPLEALATFPDALAGKCRHFATQPCVTLPRSGFQAVAPRHGVLCRALGCFCARHLIRWYSGSIQR